MKQYTLNMTEEEMLYIRRALCDRNLKMTSKVMRAREDKNTDGIEWAKNLREIGRGLIKMIDTIRETE